MRLQGQRESGWRERSGIGRILLQFENSGGARGGTNAGALPCQGSTPKLWRRIELTSFTALEVSYSRRHGPERFDRRPRGRGPIEARRAEHHAELGAAEVCLGGLLAETFLVASLCLSLTSCP